MYEVLCAKWDRKVMIKDGATGLQITGDAKPFHPDLNDTNSPEKYDFLLLSQTQPTKVILGPRNW